MELVVSEKMHLMSMEHNWKQKILARPVDATKIRMRV